MNGYIYGLDMNRRGSVDGNRRSSIEIQGRRSSTTGNAFS